jgi:hypothetical protein
MLRLPEISRLGSGSPLIRVHRLRRVSCYQPGRNTRFSVGIASARDSLRDASALPGFFPVSISARWLGLTPACSASIRCVNPRFSRHTFTGLSSSRIRRNSIHLYTNLRCATCSMTTSPSSKEYTARQIAVPRAINALSFTQALRIGARRAPQAARQTMSVCTPLCADIIPSLSPIVALGPC